MLDNAPKFSFHLEGATASGHAIPASVLVQVVENAQNAVELIGYFVEGKEIKRRLRIPARLWQVPPATFAGGEQQRVNIARGFIRRKPVLLLDEPTASLDTDNRITVTAMINEARMEGAAIVGIFHDARVREAVATRTYDMRQAQ